MDPIQPISPSYVRPIQPVQKPNAAPEPTPTTPTPKPNGGGEIVWGGVHGPNSATAGDFSRETTDPIPDEVGSLIPTNSVGQLNNAAPIGNVAQTSDISLTNNVGQTSNVAQTNSVAQSSSVTQASAASFASSTESITASNVSQKVEMFLGSVDPMLTNNAYLKLLIAALIMQVLLGEDGGAQKSNAGLQGLEALTGGRNNAMFVSIESSTNTVQLAQQSSRLDVSSAVQTMTESGAAAENTGQQMDVTG